MDNEEKKAETYILSPINQSPWIRTCASGVLEHTVSSESFNIERKIDKMITIDAISYNKFTLIVFQKGLIRNGADGITNRSVMVDVFIII